MEREQTEQLRRGDPVEVEHHGEPRRGTVVSVRWSASLGDVLVIHLDDNPRGVDPDLVLTGPVMARTRLAAA